MSTQNNNAKRATKVCRNFPELHREIVIHWFDNILETTIFYFFLRGNSELIIIHVLYLSLILWYNYHYCITINITNVLILWRTTCDSKPKWKDNFDNTRSIDNLSNPKPVCQYERKIGNLSYDDPFPCFLCNELIKNPHHSFKTP